jgi:hypothetical protein
MKLRILVEDEYDDLMGSKPLPDEDEFQDPIFIQVFDDNGLYDDAEAVPITHRTDSGKVWQSIEYEGGQYQLFGGIRGPYRINIDIPLEDFSP